MCASTASSAFSSNGYLNRTPEQFFICCCLSADYPNDTTDAFGLELLSNSGSHFPRTNVLSSSNTERPLTRNSAVNTSSDINFGIVIDKNNAFLIYKLRCSWYSTIYIIRKSAMTHHDDFLSTYLKSCSTCLFQ